MDNFFGTVGLAMRAGKVMVGARMVEKAVTGGKARAVVAAEDMGAGNRRKIEVICAREGVPIIYRGTAEQLSRSIGKKNVPVICVCDENFAKAIAKY